MKVNIVFPFLLMTLTGYGQFKNITLASQSEPDQSMVEPSITINLKDPKNIVAAMSLNRIVYSEDGGVNWQTTEVNSPFGVFGDVVLTSDAKGNIYFFHLSDPSGKGHGNTDEWLDRIVCQKSEDGGKTWSEGESIGNNPPKDQDKPWVAVNPKKGDIYVTWTQFDKYASTDTACHSNILFSRSQKEGKKWSSPVVLNQFPGDCLDDDFTTEGAVPAVTADGKIYVAWSYGNHIYLDRSFDGGSMWLHNDIPVGNQPGGWAMDIPGLGRCNGMPVLVADNSQSPFKGSLYLVWADQRNGTDDTDIWFMRSANHGDNWTVPERVNQDGPGKHQFLPWLAVDQTTGIIYIVYYDRRNYDDLQTDVYLAFSIDGGATFKEVKISESPFVPTADEFFGDYTNVAAHKSVITPIWTRMDEGKTSIVTSVIKQTDLIQTQPSQKK